MVYVVLKACRAVRVTDQQGGPGVHGVCRERVVSC